jgi:hypothetical protein
VHFNNFRSFGVDHYGVPPPCIPTKLVIGTVVDDELRDLAAMLL